MALRFSDITQGANAITNAANVTSNAMLRGRALDQGDRQLTQQQQEIDAAQKAAVKKQSEIDIAKLLEPLSVAAASGTVAPEQIQKLAQTSKKWIARAAANAGHPDPEAYATARIDNTIASSPSPQQTAPVAGEAAAAQTMATENALGIPGMAADTARAGLASEIALEQQRQAAARASGASAMAAGVRARIAEKQAAMAGLSTMTFQDPNGQVQAVRVGDPNAAQQITELTENGFVQVNQPDVGDAGGGTVKPGTPAQVAGAEAEVAGFDDAIGTLDRIIKDMEENPSNYGAGGSLKKGLETAGDIADDLIPGAGAVGNAISSLMDRLGGGTKTKEFESIAATDPARAALISQVAQAIQPTGKPLASTMQRAYDLTNFRGWRGVNQAKSKAEEIRNLLVEGRQRAIGEAESLGATIEAPIPLPATGTMVIQYDENGVRVK